MSTKKPTGFARKWQTLCKRLGVKPKQFAMLLTITVVAGGGLGVKAMMKPRKAGATPVAARAKAETTAPAAGATVDGASADGTGSSAGGSPAARPANRSNQEPLRIILDTQPARDPFRPFFLVADQKQTASHSDQPAGTPQLPPKGVVLRAIIAGEFAVINDETLAVGDEIVDGDGKIYVLEEIQERRVVLREGDRIADLTYAAATKKKSGGTTKSSAAKK